MPTTVFRNVARCANIIRKIYDVKFKINVTPIRMYYKKVPDKLTVYHQKGVFLDKTIIALTVLGWLGFEKSDEEVESELIMTLKRSILAIEREEFDKAEQMLHLALKLAQLQQNSQGIIYCYDLMANLAMDQHQLEKAEKLFTSTMQMLLINGVDQGDMKVIHISLKLARINQMLAREDVAKVGYEWCLNAIKAHKKLSHDGKALYGVIQDWYAQFLLDNGKIVESADHLREAYKTCLEVKGKYCEQGMLLLNDLAITCWRAGDMQKAELFLQEAIDTGNRIDNKTHLGVIYANMGLILLQKGLVKEAENNCKFGYRLGKQNDNNESMEQSNYCFEQIKRTIEEAEDEAREARERIEQES